MEVLLFNKVKLKKVIFMSGVFFIMTEEHETIIIPELFVAIIPLHCLAGDKGSKEELWSLKGEIYSSLGLT